MALTNRERVERNTVPATLPILPEMRLRLVTEGSPLWRASEATLKQLGLVDPYWAYAWAGGQGVARHVLNHPELVAGKRVLDFATGCGLVALAAKMAGAATVVASEIDAVAVESAMLNAALNDVTIEVVHADLIDDPCNAYDVILAGDIFFETKLAARCMRWFGELARNGKLVLIGDPGRHHLPKQGLERRARFSLPVNPELDDEGVRNCSVFAVLPPTQ